MAGAGAAAALGGLLAIGRFRAEMRRRAGRLEAGGTMFETGAGTIEATQIGTGPVALVIHGAGGGYDQGLALGTELFGTSHRIVAPSRFGYLRTPVPADPSAAAQADTHAALLDTLGIQRAIVAGVSAGAPSAIEFALRHPDRTEALILVVPLAYSPETEMGPPTDIESRRVLALVERAADLAFWVAARAARRSVLRFLGVPPKAVAAAGPDEQDRLDRIIADIEPLSRRITGIALERAPAAPWPLERVSSPTLVITAEDDLYGSLPGARFTAEAIHGARLVIFPSGGHLLVGRGAEVRAIIAEFLGAATRAASDEAGSAAVGAEQEEQPGRAEIEAG